MIEGALAVYEVGYAYKGCRDLGRQRAALQRLLDECGDDRQGWETLPEIRDWHNHDASIGLLDFGSKVFVNRDTCGWAVFGVRRGTSGPARVPYGTALPSGDA